MIRIENIDFCIRYLLEQNKVDTEMPETLQEKQLLLRALSNIWEPQPLSDEFLVAQDSELQAQLAEKGIVDPERELSFFNSQFSISLWQGDITRLKVDAIVNAANSRGLGCWHPLHACIDNAIHSAAGLQLRQECNNTLRGGEIATDEAIITPGFNLPAKYVIHTVGPIIATGIPTLEQERQLADNIDDHGEHQGNALAGLDWYPGNDWNLSVQYNQTFGTGEETSLATLRISKAPLNNSLTLSTFAYADVKDLGVFNRFSVDWAATDQIHVLLGYDLFYAEVVCSSPTPSTARYG